MTKLTVKFGNNVMTKTRQSWIKELVKNVIENCQDDGVYCDNTVHDFYLYGFKGIQNMTDEELLTEIQTTLEYKYQSEEV